MFVHDEKMARKKTAEHCGNMLGHLNLGEGNMFDRFQILRKAYSQQLELSTTSTKKYDRRTLPKYLTPVPLSRGTLAGSEWEW